MKAAEGEQPPQEEIQLQLSQQITVPVAALKDDQAAVTPESPVQAASFREDDDSSEDSSASAPAALQTATKAPPQEGKDTDLVGGASSVTMPRGSATENSSRTICLRTLRGSKSSGAISSLAGWGGVAVAAAAAAAATATATGAVAAGGEEQGGSQTSASASGGMGVLPTANKVVDLRQVKKVKPDPFEASAAAAAAAAAVAVAAAAASGAPVPDRLETLEEEAGGPVKIDISAGKRMIEFQLKQNAAEEKREAERLKCEKDRADAALAEESQRMLAQVNARMQAKRGGRGGLLGWGNEDLADQVSYGGGGALDRLAPNQVKTLAEKHGIVVKFVDDGAASGVAQVRALARAHGIRIQILGDNDGGDVGDEVEEEEKGEEKEDGHEAETPVGGRRALRVVGNESPTPPPVLSSLRSRAAPPRRSPSPVPHMLPKVSARKPPAAAAGEGMFSGPARMMRRALEASGGCVPSANEASPAVTSRGGNSAPSTEAKGMSASSSDSGAEKGMARSNTTVSGDSSTAEPTLKDDARQQSAKTTANSNGSRVTGTGGTVRPRPTSAESSGGGDADSKGANDGVVSTAVSRDGRLEGVRRRIGGGGNVAAAAAAAAAASSNTGGSTGSLAGRKRREVPKDSSQGEGGGGRVATAERARPTRAIDGSDGGSGAAGGRMESRLGSRNSSSPGEEGARSESGRGSPETTSAGLPISAPKRMRLVAPSGLVVSQAAPSSKKSGRRTASGAGARGPGNNNLFKGAMAGIIGRGKRPAP